jgi:predicted NUDIX family NTP pyrophosphohydrolase
MIMKINILNLTIDSLGFIMSKNERHEVSAGILVYRIVDNEIQVLLGKNGGPRWKNKSIGAWNIPKGHVEDGENIFDTAIREFMEETSLNLNIESYEDVIYLDSSKTKSGKTVHIWALEYDYVPNEYKVEISSNMVETEWPPKSGTIIEVPELSEAYYFKMNVAKRMIFPYQKCFLEKLEIELKDKLNGKINEEI